MAIIPKLPANDRQRSNLGQARHPVRVTLPKSRDAMSERHAEPNRPTVGELRINLAPGRSCFGIGSLSRGLCDGQDRKEDGRKTTQ